jgi:mono/diheme cytochrome c family protein
METKVVLRAALLLCLSIATKGIALAQDEEIARGQALTTKLCAECHAVGRTGASPDAGAPTFRSIDDHTDLDAFMVRLRTGQPGTHPDRPGFHFSRDDGEAVVTYLRSIQGP